MQLLIMKYDKGTHTKGDIVEIRASSTGFGGLEPVTFVLAEVPDLPMADYKDKSSAWERLIDFSVSGQDLSVDGYRLKLFSTLVAGTSGIITREEVEAFINSWGGVVFSVAVNEVLFDITIFDALTSKPFWDGRDISQILFSEISYDQETGIHQIQADYSALENNPTYIETVIANKGMTVTSHNEKIITFEGDRETARNEFQKDIKEKSKKLVERRRYYVNPGVVDYIINQGGSIVTSKATLDTYIKDKLA
jgi:hypothetical protein